MKTWPKNPVIYEINTWVWLRDPPTAGTCRYWLA